MYSLKTIAYQFKTCNWLIGIQTYPRKLKPTTGCSAAAAAAAAATAAATAAAADNDDILT